VTEDAQALALGAQALTAEAQALTVPWY